MERSNAAFERACRRAIIISIDFSQEDILKALRDARGQIGIVRDRANGKTLGIVTLEDVLESLVGDVREAKPAKVVDQSNAIAPADGGGGVDLDERSALKADWNDATRDFPPERRRANRG